MPVALHNESKSATSASNSGDVASTCDESHADSSNSVSRIGFFMYAMFCKEHPDRLSRTNPRCMLQFKRTT